MEIRKKLESKKNGEISRNLRFSRFFSSGSILTVRHGTDDRKQRENQARSIWENRAQRTSPPTAQHSCDFVKRKMRCNNLHRTVGTDDRTWTCTLFALEPKSNVSANFTTSAKRYYYSIKSSNVKQKAKSQASLYDFANFFYFYIKKLLLFADCFDIVISACGSDSVVECHLAKVKVAGPNPVSRSTQSIGITRYDTAS